MAVQAVGYALALASTAINTVGAIKKGDSEGDAADFNRQRALYAATQERQKAESDATQYEVQAKKAIGSQIANFGASGGQNENANDVLAESVKNSEMDRLNILHSGELRALGYQSNASLYGFQGQSARAGGYLGAAGALTGGLSRMMQGGGGGTSGGGSDDSGVSGTQGMYMSGNY